MVEQRQQPRRTSDTHSTPCAVLQEQVTLAEEIRKELKDIRDLLEAWNNAKGFVRTIQTIGTIVKWITAFGASITLIYYWLKK